MPPNRSYCVQSTGENYFWTAQEENAMNAHQSRVNTIKREESSVEQPISRSRGGLNQSGIPEMSRLLADTINSFMRIDEDQPFRAKVREDGIAKAIVE